MDIEGRTARSFHLKEETKTMTRKTLLKSAFFAAALSAAASGAAQAADTGEGYINAANPAVLTVVSNGSSYTKLNQFGMVAFGGKLKYDVGTAGRIHSWKAWPKIVNGYGIATETPGLKAYNQSKSYPWGARPKSINTNIALAVPANVLESNALLMCNWMAEGLRNQGKSDQQIFSQDREVHFEVSLKYEIDASGAGSNSPIFEYWEPHHWTVKCAKWQGPSIPQGVSDLKQPLGVIKATMQLQEVTSLNGACKVNTTTAIRATEANADVKYRFVHSGGNKSQVFTAKTAGNAIAVVKHDWDVPIEEGSEQGWFKIEAVSPSFQSNQAGYLMDCNKASAGGFQAGPQKPQPVTDLRAVPDAPKPISKLRAVGQ
jgi:hypothetical protein